MTCGTDEEDEIDAKTLKNGLRKLSFEDTIEAILTSQIPEQRKLFLCVVAQNDPGLPRGLVEELLRDKLREIRPDCERLLDILGGMNFALSRNDVDISEATALVVLTQEIVEELDQRVIEPSALERYLLVERAATGILLDTPDQNLAILGQVPDMPSYHEQVQHLAYLAGMWHARAQNELNQGESERKVLVSQIFESYYQSKTSRMARGLEDRAFYANLQTILQNSQDYLQEQPPLLGALWAALWPPIDLVKPRLAWPLIET